MRTSLRLSGVALPIAAIVALAGCGSGNPAREVASLAKAKPKSAAAAPKKKAGEQDVADAMRKYARCMREHGIDMPDPQISSNGKGGIVRIGSAGGTAPAKGKLEAAEKKCQPLMDGVVENGPRKLDPAQEAKMHDQALAFAKCMRDHGVNMPDPQFQSGGRVTQQLTGSPDDPNFKKASDACGKGLIGGGGPGASTNSASGGGVGFSVSAGK